MLNCILFIVQIPNDKKERVVDYESQTDYKERCYFNIFYYLKFYFISILADKSGCMGNIILVLLCEVNICFLSCSVFDKFIKINCLDI